METKKRYIITVSGHVQGVCFRYCCFEYALQCSLSGTVQNLGNGSVCIIVEGTVAQLEALRSWAAHGPPAAEVDSIHVDIEPYRDSFTTFQIIY